MGAFGDAFAQAYQAERERIARKALVKMQQDFQMKLAEKKFYDQLALMETEHGYKIQEEQDKYKHQKDITQMNIKGKKEIAETNQKGANWRAWLNYMGLGESIAQREKHSQRSVAAENKRSDILRQRLNFEQQKYNDLQKFHEMEQYSKAIHGVLGKADSSAQNIQKILTLLKSKIARRKEYLNNPKLADKVPALDKEIEELQANLKIASNDFKDYINNVLPGAISSLADQAIKNGVKDWKAVFTGKFSIHPSATPSGAANHISNKYYRKYKSILDDANKLSTTSFSSNAAEAPHDMWAHVAPKFEPVDVKSLHGKVKYYYNMLKTRNLHDYVFGNDYMGTGMSFKELMKLSPEERRKILHPPKGSLARKQKEKFRSFFSSGEWELMRRAATAYKRSLGYDVPKIIKTKAEVIQDIRNGESRGFNAYGYEKK